MTTPAPSLRIVFLGTPAFAVPSLHALIQSHHQVVAVISQPDRPKGRGQQVQPTPTRQTALAHGIPVLQPTKIKEEAFLQAIRDLRPDLGVVVAFGRILPDALLAIPRFGMINVHASVLPRYRGAAPIQRAVLAGDAETGVTIMRVASELDAGPVFAIAKTPIPPDATSGDMESVLAALGARELLPVVDAIAAGRAVETAQDHAFATHAGKITKAEGAIDWTRPAAAIHDQVRGLQPWPLASTTLRGERLVLRRVSGARSIAAPLPGARSTTGPISRPDTSEGAAIDLAPDSSGARSTSDPISRPGTPEGAAIDLAPDSSGARSTSDPISRPGTSEGAVIDLAPGDVAPGTVVRAHGGELWVACGERTMIQVLEIQPEGRRTMSAREFLAGRGALEGARFGT